MCPKCNNKTIEKTGVLFWIYMGVAWIATSFFLGMMLPFVGPIVRYIGVGLIVLSPLLRNFYKCTSCNKLFWKYPEDKINQIF